MLGYKNIRQFLKTYSVITGVGLIAMGVREMKFPEMSPRLQTEITILSIIMGTALWEGLRFVNRWLNKIYPFEKNITGRIVIQLVLGGIIGLTIRAVIYIWGEPKLPFHLDGMFIATTWALYLIIPTGVNMGFFTLYFIGRWKDSIVYAERLEREKSQVQFDNLKNQLNPHFLFNALTSLNSLIFENQQLASDFLQQLSKVYRYVLQNKEKNFVLLRTELEFIAHYVKLLETRFCGALKINFNIHEDSNDSAIVPVTLQILIENAIKHNVVDQSRPLNIDIITVGDYLVVSNNLQLRNKVETSNKQGLENLKSLYRFLTERPVMIENTAERFYVKIPLLDRV